MQRIVIFLAAVFLSGPVNGQWRKIADFGGAVTCVYFLDLPGTPRIGFVGTESELYKTTNGGQSWAKQWGHGDFAVYEVTDICFKDSLTGWFTMFGDTDACYRTTDGGNSWNEIYSSPYGAQGVAYNSQYNNLILCVSDFEPPSTLASTDLGNTWKVTSDSGTIDAVFLSDSIGLASYISSYSDSAYGFLRTTDGGFTWTFIKTRFGCEQVLGIPGTPVCFAASYNEITVWRSDDYGLSWKELCDFGPFSDTNGNLIGPIGTGYIKGDIIRLYLQSDSGMYVSLDSGVSWQKDGGPSGEGDPQDLFYSSKGVTIAGNTYNGGGFEVDDGLWEEDTAQAGVSVLQDSILLYANSSPNPVSTGTVITFGISQEAYVKINLFDILGEPVSGGRVPGSGGSEGFEGLFAPGNHEVPLSLQGLPSGTYFARILTAYGNVATVKLVKEQ